MTTINFSLKSSDLASRRLAIIERNKIEKYIKNNSAIVSIDMTHVSSISESYSDELFGVLVIRYGAQNVLNCLKLNNAKKHVLLSIAQVIKRRKLETETPIAI
jgi:hypothetical protein